MKEMTVQQIKRKRMQYLAYSAFTLLFCGLGYGFSLFVAPITLTYGLDKAAVATTFNIILISNCIGGISGSQILQRIGIKKDLLLSASLFLIGFLVTALFSYGNVWIVYIFYGVIYGFGSGLAYNGVIAATNLWWPDRIGFSSGTQLMCFGFGTLILGTLASSLIGVFSLPPVFIGIGLAAFACLIFGALFLSKPPENINALMMGGKAEAKTDSKHEDTYDPADEDSPLKSITFYAYYALASVMGACGATIVGSIVADAEMIGIAAAIATLLVGFQSTVNGLSRLGVGAIFDKIGTTGTVVICMGAAVIAAGTMTLAMMTSIQWLYFIGLFCCGVFYGGFPVITTSFIRRRYGMKRYPFNLSLGNACVILGSIINMIIVGVVGAQNRMTIFLVVFVLVVIAALISVFFLHSLKKDFARLDERRAEHAAKAVSGQ